MAEKLKRSSDRTLATLGASAAVAFFFSLLEATTASSWSYALGCAVLAAISFGLLLFVLKGSRYVRPGAPTNTQLQQPPPANVQRARDDA